MIRRRWTEGDIATLRRLYPVTRAREIAAQLGRTEKTIYLYARKHGLKKKKSPEFRSPATEFKPGRRPQTWVPVGTEVVDQKGYRKRKVRDDAPPGMSLKNWRFVHLIVWEETHGPVPQGHAVVFRNRDRSDIRIENLELVTRQSLMKRNSVHNLPGELKEVVYLKKTLTRAITMRGRRSNGKQDHRSP